MNDEKMVGFFSKVSIGCFILLAFTLIALLVHWLVVEVGLYALFIVPGVFCAWVIGCGAEKLMEGK